MLVGGVKRLRANDGQLSLVCSDRNITKIFEITGLDRVFTIYPTRDEAVSKLGVLGAALRLVRCAASPSSLSRPRCSRAGCGTGGISKPGDTDRGKQLFLQKCGGLPHARRRRDARQVGPEPRRRVSASREARASSK